jgi:hypothetical protein
MPEKQEIILRKTQGMSTQQPVSSDIILLTFHCDFVYIEV